MTSLYDLVGELHDVLDEVQGDVSDPDVLAKVEGLELSIEQKAEGCAKYLANLDASIEAYRAEEKRLAERRRVIENRLASIKDYLKANMIRLGARKLEVGVFTLTLADNPPRVVIDDEGEIPGEYIVITPKPDLKGIAKALKAGAPIRGAHLENGKSLRIR